MTASKMERSRFENWKVRILISSFFQAGIYRAVILRFGETIDFIGVFESILKRTLVLSISFKRYESRYVSQFYCSTQYLRMSGVN